ncbi:Bug family tripartite tricarboxylate transporter substrate binding protein [Bordetella sp. 2513F-2]
MTPILRHALRAVLLCCAVLPALSHAAGYPQRPITLVVPFGAGGITDLVARATGKALSEQIGQPVIIENKPGAGGNIAADYVRRAQPDGYTLMFATMGVLAVNPHTVKNAPFDNLKDFSYVSLVASTPHVIAVNPALPAQTLEELIELAKRKPESLSFGTAGVGSSPYQGMQIMQGSTGVEFLHVPFKSGAESVTNVVSGQIDLTFEATPVIMPFVGVQKLRALAVAHTDRIAIAPDLPSTAELGHPEILSGSTAGVIGPAGLSDEVVQKLNAALAKAVDSAEFKAALLAQGTATESSTPQAFRDLVQREDARWAKILAPALASN